MISITNCGKLKKWVFSDHFSNPNYQATFNLNSFQKLCQVQVSKFDFLSLSQVRVHEKQLPPKVFKSETKKLPAFLGIFYLKR